MSGGRPPHANVVLVRYSLGTLWCVVTLVAASLGACAGEAEPSTVASAGQEGAGDCETLCATWAASTCSGERPRSQAECETRCSAIPACAAWQRLLECAGESSTFTCMDGRATLEGCEEEQAAVGDCPVSHTLPDAGAM